MEILTYLRLLRRRWPLVVVTVAVALGTDFSGGLANGLVNLTAMAAGALLVVEAERTSEADVADVSGPVADLDRAGRPSAPWAGDWPAPPG